MPATDRSAEVPCPAPVARYDRTAMTLHWVVASFIIVNIFVGLAGVNAPKGPDQNLIALHKSIGLTVLGLILLRILWRLAHKPPALPRAYPAFDRVSAHIAHILLYVVMLLLPLTGYIHDSAWKLAAQHPIELYGLVPFPRIGFIEALDPATKEQVHSGFGAAHVYLGYLLYGLLAAHLLGVAKHHAIDHEAELQRMLPETYRRPDASA